MEKTATMIGLLVCLLLGGCSKPRVMYASETEEKNGVRYVKGESEPFNGIVIDRATAREVTFEAGMRTSDAPLREAAPASMFNAEFTRRLQREGAKSGDVEIALIWQSIDDLDLHCRDPHGEEIYFGNKHSRSRGELDVDMNVNPPFSNEPAEHIVWAEGRAPQGEYVVHVRCFTHRNGNRDPVKFTLAVKAQGDVRYFERRVDDQQKLEVHRFRID